MLRLLECLQHADAAHRLRGGFLRSQLGMRGFEIGELTVERVVFAIGNLGRRVLVIEAVMPFDQRTESGDAVSRVVFH